MHKTVYKIFRPSEWETFVSKGVFDGSANDKQDGFIHLSYRDQLAGTLDAHFSDCAKIIVAAFPVVAFEQSSLKAEKSRRGELFPHLYDTLKKQQVTSFAPIKRTEDGDLVIPNDLVD
ncbi:hypothetical protein GCM10017044_07480 [Kordiimonas sediminis]|uniref:DUF952 domain-containing protein n=1 Tax=Kordiimonas sediminis TaxID=1735581 RepID=A0A919E603_9PROT|nr:DUF952 domain-containing protein [Kordiimonas sediminis]GHF15776.1 hypothetical protein GCM10017044_07480 [Kordiimonas sediminis]